jgi:ketol-acid reductoisomerase
LIASFGNQGAAQAQNLRDSGIPNDKILIANREDYYAADARSKGFMVEHDFGKAAEVADGVIICFSKVVCMPLTVIISPFLARSRPSPAWLV